MSNNDRKAVSILIYLLTLQDAGHYMHYTNDVARLLNNVLDAYKPIKINSSDHTRAFDYLKTIENEIEQSDIDSSVLMMLSVTIAIAEEYMRFTKDSKQHAWQVLYDYCKSKLSINYQSFGEELDKASEVSEIICAVRNI